MKIRAMRRMLFLRVLAAGLGMLAVLCLNPDVSGTAGHCSDVVFAAIDANCEVFLDAGNKQLNTPYHAYNVSTGAMSMGGAPMKTETIFVGGTLYTQILGKWTSTMLSMQDIKNMADSNRSKNQSATCQHVRDEAVNGEDAAVYIASTQGERMKSEQTMWISKSDSLPLRLEVEIVSVKSGAKSHMSIRYEYANVQKPSM